MAPDKDIDSSTSAPSSAGGIQSKRPPLSRQHSEVSEAQHRPRQHQKQHHVGRLHNRVPSSKSLHKQQAQATAAAATSAAGKTALSSSSVRRTLSPTESAAPHHRSSTNLQSHKRTTSEVKLPWETAANNAIQRSASQSAIKRNRSQGEIHKRTRSTDKIKRNSGGTATANRPKSSKGQVHFDLGSDGQDEDEWVDASGSNSPHLSRKGSINSSAQSSVRPLTSSTSNSRSNSRPASPEQRTAEPEQPLSEHEQSNHKEYPTSRLLKRTPSHTVQPQMTAEMAQASQPRMASGASSQAPSPTMAGSSGEGLTSRFVGPGSGAGSGVTSQGSFYRPDTSNGLHHHEGISRNALSGTNLSKSEDTPQLARIADDRDDSALVPKSSRRVAGNPTEPSRIQQKLNLQRASSAIEPRHNPPTVPGNIGASPLIGVAGPAYDGAGGRDPRMGKLLERTGMEYLMIRRHQNPVARSMARLGCVPSTEKTRRIPRTNTGSMNSKRSLDLGPRHIRKTSTNEAARRPITPRDPRDSTSIRTVTAGSSYEGEDDNRLAEGLSGSSLVGGEDDDGTAAILRSMWEKSMDLSASGD